MVRPIRHYCEIRQQTSEIWAGTSPRRPLNVGLSAQPHQAVGFPLIRTHEGGFAQAPLAA